MVDQIQGGQSLGQVQASFPGLSQATFMTPDCLLAYCSSRLRDLDTSMQQQFKQQQTGIADAEKLQAIEQRLKQLYEAGGKDDKGLIADFTDGRDNAALVQLRDDAAKIVDPQARQTALKAIDACGDLKKGNKFEDFKASVLDGLDNGRQSLSQGSELGMIGLQSLMSQRQTAVQLTTNLVQALGEQLKAVAGNVGK